MIVNFQHGFVFIHIPQNGGTSIRQALTSALTDSHTRRHRLANSCFLRRYRRHLAVSTVTQHETYQEFIAQFTDRTGERNSAAYALRPIAFVRHPVSRIISLHRLLVSTTTNSDFQVPNNINDWIALLGEEGIDRHPDLRGLRTQSSYVDGMGENAFLGRLEYLGQEIVRLGELLGTELQLPHFDRNAIKAANKKIWQGLTDKSMDVIAQLYRHDFAQFGYDFISDSARPVQLP